MAEAPPKPGDFEGLGPIGVAQLQSKGFYVRLATSAPRPAPRPPADCTVLVVEDDEGTGQAIVRVLDHLGYRTRRARNRAESATALAQQPLPDLVLLDVNLPDVNGFDILDRIRQHPALKRVPVIMLTSLSDTSDLARGLMLGADGYLTKPARPGTLADAVQAILG